MGILADPAKCTYSCWYTDGRNLHKVHNATGAQQVHHNVTILKIVFKNTRSLSVALTAVVDGMKLLLLELNDLSAKCQANEKQLLPQIQRKGMVRSSRKGNNEEWG